MFTCLKALATAMGVAATSGMLLAMGAAPASADSPEAGSPKVVPLSGEPKRCDFSDIGGIPPATNGTGYTVVSSNGSTVTAEVHLTGFQPGIWYGLRVVEMPRPNDHCGASDPGVIMGRLYTDDNGNATATIQGPIMRGATGAWLSVEGPNGDSQLESADVRTSDYIAKF